MIVMRNLKWDINQIFIYIYNMQYGIDLLLSSFSLVGPSDWWIEHFIFRTDATQRASAFHIPFHIRVAGDSNFYGIFVAFAR